jgi:hypothetical protein
MRWQTPASSRLIHALRCYSSRNARSGITWMTKEGLRKPNFWGSLTQASTVRIGNFEGEEVYIPFKALLPIVEPTDVVLGGWDISGLNMADAMERAQVCRLPTSKHGS